MAGSLRIPRFRSTRWCQKWIAIDGLFLKLDPDRRGPRNPWNPTFGNTAWREQVNPEIRRSLVSISNPRRFMDPVDHRQRQRKEGEKNFHVAVCNPTKYIFKHVTLPSPASGI